MLPPYTSHEKSPSPETRQVIGIRDHKVYIGTIQAQESLLKSNPDSHEFSLPPEALTPQETAPVASTAIAQATRYDAYEMSARDRELAMLSHQVFEEALPADQRRIDHEPTA